MFLYVPHDINPEKVDLLINLDSVNMVKSHKVNNNWEVGVLIHDNTLPANQGYLQVVYRGSEKVGKVYFSTILDLLDTISVDSEGSVSLTGNKVDFAEIMTKDFTGLVNPNSISKIIPRPRHGDTSHPDTDWEVAVFYENTRRFNPLTGAKEWVGTYDVYLTGSKDSCHDYVATFVREHL